MRLNEIRFQYNPLVVSSPNTAKADVKKVFLRNRDKWQLGTGLDSLIEKISYTHQFGINTKSTKNKDIESYDLCCLDYDAFSKDTNSPISFAKPITVLRNLSIIRDFCQFDQPSLSYKDDSNNTHFYFVFDKTVKNQADFELIVKTLNKVVSDEIRSLFGLDEKDNVGFDGCVANNPGQVIFGGYQPVFRNDSAMLLPVDDFLSLASALSIAGTESTAKRSPSSVTPGGFATAVKTQAVLNISLTPESPKDDNLKLAKPETEERENEKLGVTDQVLHHLFNYLFIDKFGGDIQKLYSHTETYTQRNLEDSDKEDNVIERWEGANPFSESNNSGSSFMIVVTNGKLPRFWDKSGNFQKLKRTGFNTAHGTFLDYFFFQHKKEIYSDIELVDGQYPKGFFSRLVKDICTTYEIEQFKFTNNLMGIFREILDHCKANVYIEEWDKSKADFNYLVFDHSQASWMTTIETKLFRQYTDDLLLEFADHDLDNLFKMFKDYLEFTEIKTKKDVFQYFKDWFILHSKPVLKKLKKRPKSSGHLVSLENGVFNFKSRKLEAERGQAWHIDTEDAKLPYNYYPVADDHPVITRYKQYILDWIGDEDQFNLLLSWQLLCVKREAYKTRNMLILMGKNSGGKSTFANQTVLIMSGGMDKNGKANIHQSAQKMTATRLLDDNTHSTTVLEGLSFLYLDEMNSLPLNANIEALKDYVQPEYDRQQTINPKGQKIRKIETYFSMIGASESVLKFRTSAGLDKRIVYCSVDKANMGLKKEVDFFSSQENCEILFNWMVSQPTDIWIDTWNKYRDCDKVTSNLVSQKKESEPLCEFIDHCFEITNDASDRVTVNEVWTSFNAWKIEEVCDLRFSSKQKFSSTFHQMLQEPKYGFFWKGEKKQISGGYAYQMLRLKKPSTEHQGSDSQF